jgi:hypothetical protein
MLPPCTTTLYLRHRENRLRRRVAKVACGRWRCPCCIQKLRHEWAAHAAAEITERGRPVHVAVIPQARWGAIQRAIQRGGAEYVFGAQYIRIVHDPAEFLVVATVPVPGSSAIPAAEAACRVRAAIMAATQTRNLNRKQKKDGEWTSEFVRPVSTSDKWALRRKKTNEWAKDSVLPSNLGYADLINILNPIGVEPTQKRPRRLFMRVVWDFDLPDLWDCDRDDDRLWMALQDRCWYHDPPAGLHERVPAAGGCGPPGDPGLATAC